MKIATDSPFLSCLSQTQSPFSKPGDKGGVQSSSCLLLREEVPDSDGHVMEGRRSYKQNWLNWEEEEMSMLQLERKRMWAVLQVEERRRKILINLM